MSQTLEEATRAALRRLEIPYSRHEETGDFVLHIPCSPAAATIVVIDLDEDSREATITAPICWVPQRRQAAVALRLAEYNSTYRFLTFSMADGLVLLDTCAECSRFIDPEPFIALSLVRVLRALRETKDAIGALAQSKRSRSPSRAVQEAEMIINQLDP